MNQLIGRLAQRVGNWFNRKKLPNDLNAIWQKLTELPEISNSRLSYQEKQVYGLVKASHKNLRSAKIPQVYLLKLLMEEIITITDVDELEILNADKLISPEKLQGEVSDEFQIKFWAAPLLIGNLGRLLLEEGGANFWEMAFCSPLNKDYPEFSLTLQKHDGKAPSILLEEANEEIRKLEGVIASFESQALEPVDVWQ